MTLAPGTKLGPYEILAPIDAGGIAALNHPLRSENLPIDT
jgi:hypothetical protein